MSRNSSNGATDLGMFWETFQNASVGLAHVGLDGTFLDVNPYFCDLVGYSHDELLLRTFGDITHPDDLATDWEQAMAVAEGRAESYTMEKRYFHRDRRIVWVRLTGSIIRDAEGRPRYYIAIVQDISRQKIAEAASQAKSDFLSSMSHELRTPLNGIYGMAQILHAGDFGPLNDEQRSSLADILTSSEHLMQLINDLLDLAKVEAGKWELSSEWIDPNALLVQTSDAMAGMATQGRLRLTVDTDDTISRMWTDPRLFRQILYNYLSNAIKFTPPGGHVRASIKRCQDGFARLEVSDTGQGIGAQNIARLFSAFEQMGTNERAKLKGTGLGLALVKKFTTMLGGEVGVESTPGKGSTFFALLPINPTENKG